MIASFAIARLARAALIVPLLLAGPARSQSAPRSAAGHPAAHRSRHHGRVALHSRPVSPASPSETQTASASTPAPVPDEALTSPPDRRDPSANVAPSVFSLHYPPQGDGYVTGSSPQAMDDRNAARATGVQATLPLPQ